ncbi:MAG TPA: NAD(P)-dependent alcohol dehydrogenase [Anaerolineales bacterium]|nr:NAD(P)-dependent alcohol dehydrogenase [Anaerolineales bacterium]HNN12379.1 NAD(P)-dependent alcohol dehydrogenase [Anaerolineales bacterium]HNO30879.1 NAD(P)-dependent alcohol dehydrogenase [Anaerolineales bacterium]
MKAVVHYSYGSPDVLKLEEIEKPVVTEYGVLVRTHASSVNPAEWYGLTGLMIARLMGGLFKPKDSRIGADFSGVVEAVGSKVTHLKPGDEVYGGRNGAYAEYIHVVNAVVRKPANITFEEAAAVPTAGITALQGLRDHGKVKLGDKVLINGAAGGVGTFAVQIAKAFGAEVTGVTSTKNVERVRSLGADVVVDYTQEDFTRNGKTYDLIFDIAGNRNWKEYKRVMKPNSNFILVGAPKGNKVLGPVARILKLKAASLGSSQTAVFFIAQFNRPDLDTLRELIESGKVKPVVEKVYPLGKVVDAMKHLGTGHAWGKIVLKIN